METFGRLHAFISGDVPEIACYLDLVGIVYHVLAFQAAEWTSSTTICS
jgi:hypothetical protein